MIVQTSFPGLIEATRYFQEKMIPGQAQVQHSGVPESWACVVNDGLGGL